MSGGDSWMTGSPRSSARQIRPSSISRGESRWRRSRSASRPLELGLGGFVLHQLDAVEVAHAADVADERQVRAASSRAARNSSSLALHVAEDVVSLQEVEVGQRHRAAHRVAAEGDAVQERVARVEERLGDAVAHHHAAEGRVAGREALGHGDHVGLVADALDAEPGAQAAEGADHLVGHEQHAVAVADLADPGEVALGRGEAAAGVLHRLEEDGGDRFGALLQDGALDVVGAAQRAGRRVGAQVQR